jgi:hypothetical protein
MRLERTLLLCGMATLCGAIALGSMAGTACAQAGNDRNPAVEGPAQVESETIELPIELEESEIAGFFKKVESLARASDVLVELVERTSPEGNASKVILVRASATDTFLANAQAQRFRRLISDEQSKRVMARNTDLMRVTLSFPGGTVEEFVRAVSERAKLPKPTFTSSYVANLKMRSVELSGLEVRSALRLLEKLPPTNFEGIAVPLAADFIGAEYMPTDAGSALPYLQQSVFVIGPATDPPAAPDTVRRAAFWLGSDAVSDEALKILFDAIAFATDFDGESMTFKAKYHQPSRLLIVRGTRDELGVVAQIVKSQFAGARAELPSFEPKEESDRESMQTKEEVGRFVPDGR